MSAPLRLELAERVAPAAWDAEAAALGGGFFQSTAYAGYDACYPGTSSLFVRAFAADGTLAGLAVGTLATPGRWPLSRFARTLSLGALPATRVPGDAAKAGFLRALEARLPGLGVHRLEVKAYDSEDGAGALASLAPEGYALRERCEFHLDLSAGAQAAWDGFKSERRTAIRKAEKQGLVSAPEEGPEAVQSLFDLQAVALGRKGVTVDASEGLARATLELVRSGHGQLWITRLQGEALNAALIGLCRDRAYYVASGSSPQGFKLAGPAHLVWSAIQRLAQDGIRAFNLAGAPPAGPDPAKVDGLHRFKKDFGSRVVSQPAGTKELPGVGSLLTRMKKALVPAA